MPVKGTVPTGAKCEALSLGMLIHAPHHLGEDVVIVLEFIGHGSFYNSTQRRKVTKALRCMCGKQSFATFY
jgi:hypothetical protein